VDSDTLRETWLPSLSSLPPRGGDHRGGAGCEDFFSSLLAIKIYKTKPFRSEQELGLNCLRGGRFEFPEFGMFSLIS
jgi:hypothetical protein